MKQALIALEDGRTFSGESFGASGTTVGEICFNTSMTGYQEILTDPSYAGQIVCMTYPLIGNYGVNDQDVEERSGHGASRRHQRRTACGMKDRRSDSATRRRSCRTSPDVPTTKSTLDDQTSPRHAEQRARQRIARSGPDVTLRQLQET